MAGPAQVLELARFPERTQVLELGPLPEPGQGLSSVRAWALGPVRAAASRALPSEAPVPVPAQA